MEKNVKISIIGIQSGGDLPETQRVEVKTDGFLKVRDSIRSFYYEENSEESGKNISVFKCSEREAEHNKKGDVSTSMRFCPGEITKAYYDTPFGRFNLDITTQNYYFEENKTGGSAEIKYSMVLNDGAPMDCITKIVWEKITS